MVIFPALSRMARPIIVNFGGLPNRGIAGGRRGLWRFESVKSDNSAE
jgi:hypothetical protein